MSPKFQAFRPFRGRRKGLKACAPTALESPGLKAWASEKNKVYERSSFRETSARNFKTRARGSC
jgi:hypothetical protein